MQKNTGLLVLGGLALLGMSGTLNGNSTVIASGTTTTTLPPIPVQAPQQNPIVITQQPGSNYNPQVTYPANTRIYVNSGIVYTIAAYNGEYILFNERTRDGMQASISRYSSGIVAVV